jgi:DNA replication protein DnaC
MSFKDLNDALTRLRLPTIRKSFEELARQAEADTWSFEQYLLALVQQECEEREVNRRLRYVRESGLPEGKRLENFERDRLSRRVNQNIEVLRDGHFLKRHENILAFGNPGSGKTHLLSALGHELIAQGHRVFFTSCALFVQQLLRAKAELKLAKYFKRLRQFDVVILDDLGYVQQSREEMEVLFTFFAERYERGSIMVSSNLPFSQWEQIFKNPMVTAAAIDRLIHHSVILELNLPSFRMEQAKTKHKGEGS